MFTAAYSKDVVRPSAEECVRNPRARSTKMRWAVQCRGVTAGEYHERAIKEDL